MKAFLSHSSKDKEFVEAIAKELGRQYCVYDSKSFESGKEFRESILKGLDESAVFVLFLSKHSKDSVWVDFELGEAWYQTLHKKIDKSLVYLLDTASHESVPEWLRRARIDRIGLPAAVARDIKHHLDSLLRKRQQPFFVGRSTAVAGLEELLTPLDGTKPPQIVCISGLPGVGRRSLIKYTSPKLLNLYKYIEIRFSEGDSVNDICIRLADHVEPYSTKDGFDKIVREIKSFKEDNALERILRNIKTVIDNNELLIFYDDGGLLDIEGYLRPPVNRLINAIPSDYGAYIFFVSYRKPQKSTGSNLPVLQLHSLGKHETKRLVSMLATRAKLALQPDQLSELAEYVSGYPPAAYFAVEQAKDYGIDLVMKDKSQLVQFTASVFIKHIAELTLEYIDKNLLQLVAAYSPLPLAVIVDVLQDNIENISDCILEW